MGVALVALVIAITGAAYAAGSSSPKTLSACVHHRGGGLYIAKKCRRHDRRVRWDVRGPQGEPGAPGSAGAKGSTGPTGPATGAAGGALAGSYPNPGLATGAVGTTNFATGAQAPNSAELGGSPPTSFLQFGASLGATDAVPFDGAGYYLDTSTTNQYSFNEVAIDATGAAGHFALCGNIPGDSGSFDYVVYINGARTTGMVGADSCTTAFDPGAGGDFMASIRRTIIFGVTAGDSTTDPNYDIFGFYQP